jgi:bifunctional UDP-N-acetylglucosamine pyrophosphorylase/glucosamine-1-phosphate N-acetyltransferase
MIGQSCRIEGCVIGSGAEVDHSVLKESRVGENTMVGPFAYIRPGSNIGANCRIGDFVEVKNSNIGDGTKVSHLTYIGDADLGKGINVGCGVVFVNYDGRDKHRSFVGDGAFIGCNVNIISPIRIGPSAYIAAGGTVTCDVPPGALHMARERGRNIENWVERRGLWGPRSEEQGG